VQTRKISEKYSHGANEMSSQTPSRIAGVVMNLLKSTAKFPIRFVCGYFCTLCGL